MFNSELVEVDNVDREILEILKKDCTKSYRTIATELNRATGTISKRIKDMEELGIINNFSVNLDYEKLGYDIMAIMELTISQGKLIEVEKQIAEKPNVFGVYDLTGTYDALIFLRTKTRNELNKIIKEILRNKYIERTNTHIVLNIIKEDSNLI
ncbi:MAG: Lrp/AsnC family transcriptional regulator [Promethearchaeota archaeon]